jgi:excisionase family DNA binding protein
MQSSPPESSPADSYSTAAVARRLGVSVPTVQRWVDAGALKAWKTVGGHRRIDAVSADAFIRGLSQPGAQAGAPAPAGPAASGAPPRRRDAAAGPVVLIVDDSDSDRDLLAAVAAEAFPGARISLAENGFEGLIAIGHEAPDVLITDIVMPHMDGIEMQRQVAALASGRPRVLVAVSSLSAAELARRGALPPGVCFVTKPIEPDALVALLREQLAADGRATG